MPDDPTPHGGEVFHEVPDRAKIPQPKSGAGDDAATRHPQPPTGTDAASGLPKEDVDGKPSVTRQPD